MILYSATKQQFMDDVESDRIVSEIVAAFQRTGARAPRAELGSWNNSMQYMYKVLNTSSIPSGCGVAIEFKVPLTSKRIDFLLSGRTHDGCGALVVVELKQWSQATTVPGLSEIVDPLVETYVGGAHRQVPHPSYQAWSYAQLLKDFSEPVQGELVSVHPCAYLHNYVKSEDEPLTQAPFLSVIERAPTFFSGEVFKLRSFIGRFIENSDDGDSIRLVDQGKMCPSKSLQERLGDMLDGQPEFVMIDDQKVVFEHVVFEVERARKSGAKCVFIVEGGPGTGKSVVAVNLLVELTRRGMLARYVTKNSAPRSVYSAMLRGRRSRSSIESLFGGVDSLHKMDVDEFDVLLVDEAHRLRLKSGMFGNLGEDQTKEAIAASKCTVFFIDRNQRVSVADSGEVGRIERHCLEIGITPIRMKLNSQFRCSGSDDYLAWLDSVLDISDAGMWDGFDFAYDFQVFDSAQALHSEIRKRNLVNNRSRVLAGYCWDWKSEHRDNPEQHDIRIGDDYSASWNLNSSTTWAIDAGSVDQVGCIHTSQGLEFDYVGVIVGLDMRYESGVLVTDPLARSSGDKSLTGIKKMMKEDPEGAARLADEIIKNTYRVLMTRGQKGCYVYCVDPNLNAYFRTRRVATAMPFDYRSQMIAADRPDGTPEY